MLLDKGNCNHINNKWNFIFIVYSVLSSSPQPEPLAAKMASINIFWFHAVKLTQTEKRDTGGSVVHHHQSAVRVYLVFHADFFCILAYLLSLLINK